jgi:hypothetical protein
MLAAVGIFDRWQRWSLEDVERPWPRGPSIYEHLRAHTDATTGKLKDSGARLPDEPTDAPNQLRWAAGAKDGVMGHHVGAEDEALRVKQLEKAVADVLTTATAAGLAHLYQLVTRDSMLGVIDQVLELVASNPRLRPERVHALGMVLAREAPLREAVKFGLALLGIVQGPDDEALLLQLGAHDELTLFAAVALVNRGNNEGERALFRLAQRVEGWGRIQVIERLGETRDPEVQNWMLREGFRNSVMDEYLAYTCAMTGGLHVALSAPSVDRALLRGAAGLLAALARGGPARDLADYPHTEQAVEQFLRHLEAGPVDLEVIEALDALSQRDEVSAPLKKRIDELRGSAAVRDLIDVGLASGSDTDYWRSTQAARVRGIDSFDAHQRRVLEGNLDSALFNMMQATTDANIERALATVTPQLNLGAIATGPEDSPGFGPEFAQHRQLGSVVQCLSRFPGQGSPLVLAALGSPVVNNRHAALRALAAWTRTRWPSADVVSALELAVQREPLEDLKRRMQRVLDGGPYDEAGDEQAPTRAPS